MRGLRPSLGVWPAGGVEPAVLWTWAARDAPEPGVFQPGKPRSGLGRTEEWRWRPGGARLASGGPRRRWVVSWWQGSAPRRCALGRCSLISWKPRSGAGAGHSELPGGHPPQRPQPGIDGRWPRRRRLEWTQKSLGTKQKTEGSPILLGWSPSHPRNPLPPQITYLSVPQRSGRSFWALQGLFLWPQVPQLGAGAPSAQEGLAWGQKGLRSGQRSSSLFRLPSLHFPVGEDICPLCQPIIAFTNLHPVMSKYSHTL